MCFLLLQDLWITFDKSPPGQYSTQIHTNWVSAEYFVRNTLWYLRMFLWFNCFNRCASFKWWFASSNEAHSTRLIAISSLVFLCCKWTCKCTAFGHNQKLTSASRTCPSLPLPKIFTCDKVNHTTALRIVTYDIVLVHYNSDGWGEILFVYSCHPRHLSTQTTRTHSQHPRQFPKIARNQHALYLFLMTVHVILQSHCWKPAVFHRSSSCWIVLQNDCLQFFLGNNANLTNLHTEYDITVFCIVC